MSTNPILTRVLAVAGGPTALAKRLGIRPPSIYAWSRIPPRRVAGVEAATGIPRHELRPDLWSAPETEPCAPDARACPSFDGAEGRAALRRALLALAAAVEVGDARAETACVITAIHQSIAEPGGAT